MDVGVLPACIVCVTCECLVSMKAIKQCWIPDPTRLEMIEPPCGC